MPGLFGAAAAAFRLTKEFNSSAFDVELAVPVNAFVIAFVLPNVPAACAWPVPVSAPLIGPARFEVRPPSAPAPPTAILPPDEKQRIERIHDIAVALLRQPGREVGPGRERITAEPGRGADVLDRLLAPIPERT